MSDISIYVLDLLRVFTALDLYILSMLDRLLTLIEMYFSNFERSIAAEFINQSILFCFVLYRPCLIVVLVVLRFY